MAGYGVTSLGSDSLPLGSVYPPNAPSGNPVPLQGGTINTDGSGNTSAPVRAELAPTQTTSGTLQSAATAVGNGTSFPVTGYASCVFTVTGTFVGTITFTGISQDGVTTTPLNCIKRGAGAIASIATTDGLYECDVVGLSAVEAVIASYTSGSITVTALASPVSFTTTTVRIDANQPAIPITGSISATNPSVGTDGSAIPTSSTLLGGSDGTNLQPLQVDGSHYLKVNVAAGSLSASNPSVGTDGSAIPTSSTLLGASDGTNLQPLQVDGSKNLKVTIAAGSVTATQTTGSNLHTVVDSGTMTATTNADTTIGGTTAPSKELLIAGKTNDGTPQYQPLPEGAGGRSVIVEGVAGGTAVPVSGTLTANAGTNLNTSLLAVESGGNLASAVTHLSSLDTHLPAQGAAATSASLPVNIASDQTVPISQKAATSVSATLQSAATATGAGTPLATLGHATVVFTVTGTFSATITFQGTEQSNTNYQNLDVEQMGATSAGPTVTATAPGTYIASCAGMQDVIANITAFTSGSITVTAHTLPVPFVSRRSLANIALWNGLTPGNSNPVITEDQIRGYILAGQGFTASSGKVAPSVTASTFGTAIYNPSTSGKNVLIYSIRVFANANMYGSINQVTADPAFGTTVTGYNLKPGAGNPVVTLDGAASAPSVGVTPVGTGIETTAFSAGQTTELLPNGAVLPLPSGTNNGIVIYITTSATNQVYITTYRWIEF